jgi:serine/threonine protein kinase
MELRLGRYVVLKHLASGGMADVLLGRSDGIEGFERHVVLKRIRADHAKDQRFIRMFLDEARVAAGLHHQNIVQVHDVGETDGDYFIAMEYLHGEDVRTLLSTASKSRAHVPLGHAIAIVSAAAAGLHYAHERRSGDGKPIGIVHRDVSPSNILVGYDGSIKIVDFGIAKASSREETRSGMLKGKVSYMSPEQCKGEPADRRSDVYALGVVLYELATTTRLFKGDSDFRIMEQVVHGRVALPQVRRPDLPNELSTIIMRALAPDPERRYFTADELRVALEQFAARAGLTTSTSAVAAYMRKQFGEPPEPWLQLGAEFEDSFEEGGPARPSIDSAARASWAEMPRTGDTSRASSGKIGRITGPVGVAANQGAGLVTPEVVAPGPTVSKFARHMPPPGSRRAMQLKLAMIGAPLLLLLGIAVWRLTSSSAPAPVLTAEVSRPPAPIVQELPRPAEAPPTGSATENVGSATTTPTAGAQAKTTPRTAKPRPGAAAATTATVSPSAPATGAKRIASADPAAPPEIPAPVAKAEPPAQPPVVAAPAPPAVTLPVAAPGPALGPAPAPPPLPAVVIAPVPPPPAPPAAPQIVAPVALDANRISGDKVILPDAKTQSEIARAGVGSVAGTYKLCISTEGTVSSVSPVKGTGFASYDAKIQNTIRTQWRYRPFVVNGKVVPACTAVRFLYSQS